MAVHPVMIVLRHSRRLEAQVRTAPGGVDLDPQGIPALRSVKVDRRYGPVRMPALVARPRQGPRDTGVLRAIDPDPEHATYVVRATMDEKQIKELRTHDSVIGVFSDARIGLMSTCATTGPVGNYQDVAELLGVDSMQGCGMDGNGVLVAVVDGGVNMAHLNSKGMTPSFDAAWSWAVEAGATPGSMPKGHGTMCAFDACIAAPACTIVDIALIAKQGFSFPQLLSDAVLAYSHLLSLMTLMKWSGGAPSLVVTNSWGMYHPSQDPFPVGDPGNYTDNLNHPFNLAVANLDAAGADVVFCAGNCGPDCPSFWCVGWGPPPPPDSPLWDKAVTTNAIYGANGHPQVLTVGGVDTMMERVGYSNIGPARLADKKPDVCGYTHFSGSGADGPIDSGTSAATPVVAGVVAAARTKLPYAMGNPESYPEAMRELIRSTALDLGAAGFDYEYGYGVVDGHAISAKLCGYFLDICSRYPWLCSGLQEWPRIPGPGPVEKWVDRREVAVLDRFRRVLNVAGVTGPREVAILASELLAGRATTGTPSGPSAAASLSPATAAKGCGCGGNSGSRDGAPGGRE